MKEYFHQAINIFVHSAIFLYNEIDFDLTSLLDNIMDNDNLKKMVWDKINNSLGLRININDLAKILYDNLCILEYYIIYIKDKMANINGDKKTLIDEITKLLIPKAKETRDNGEVFTPMNIVDQMLDILDEEYKNEKIFENSELTWFDPSNGMGNFLVGIYYRLLVGLKDKIPDIEERKKHIVEKMLFGCEINEYNIEISNRIFDSKKYKVNFKCLDFFKLKPKKEWNKKSFSFIIGNPPFQKNAEKDYKNSIPFYNEFIEKSLELSDRVYMINPSKWLFGVGKGLDEFRNTMLTSKCVKRIDNFNSKDIFHKSVKIEGDVNFMMIDNNYKGKCKFNNVFINLSTYDIIPVDLECLPLVEKILNFQVKNKKLYLPSIVRSQVLFHIGSQDERLMDSNDENKTNESLICYVSQKKSKNRLQYINDIKISEKKKNKFWKVMTPRANGKKKNFGNLIIGTDNEVYNESFISFEVKDKKSAESLQSYLTCKLPNLLLGLRKPTQGIAKKTCVWVPLIPLDKEWDNKKIYEYFELTETEIEIIENYCKKYKVKVNLFEPIEDNDNEIIIEDEIKVIKDKKSEILTFKNAEKMKLSELKVICASNGLNIKKCKVKSDFVNLIMSQTKVLNI